MAPAPENGSDEEKRLIEQHMVFKEKLFLNFMKLWTVDTLERLLSVFSDGKEYEVVLAMMSVVP